MATFKHILVAVRSPDQNDFFKAAAELAKAHAARLTALTVFSEISSDIVDEVGEDYSLDLTKSLSEHATSELLKLAERNSTGVKVEPKVAFGEPFLEIIRFVIANKVDLLVIAASEAHARAGSAAFRLLRKCPCPVLVVAPGWAPSQEGLVLATIDDEKKGNDVDSVNRQVLQLSAEMAKLGGGNVHVLQAWRHFGEEFQRGHWGLQPEEVEEVGKDLQSSYKQRLQKTIEKSGTNVDDANIHLVKGDAEEVILKHLKTHKIKLLVMGTVCRTGIPGFLIGNTAEKILQQVDSSVLAVKPEDFESPVTL